MPAPTIDAVSKATATIDTSAATAPVADAKTDKVKMNSGVAIQDQDVGIKPQAPAAPKNAAGLKALAAMARPTRILATVAAVFGFLGWGLPVLVGGAAVAIGMWGVETYANAKLKPQAVKA